jgi:hypothetical protein
MYINSILSLLIFVTVIDSLICDVRAVSDETADRNKNRAWSIVNLLIHEIVIDFKSVEEIRRKLLSLLPVCLEIIHSGQSRYNNTEIAPEFWSSVDIFYLIITYFNISP